MNKTIQIKKEIKSAYLSVSLDGPFPQLQYKLKRNIRIYKKRKAKN